MGLTLRLTNSGTLPGGRSCVTMVDGALTIGRGDENDLALPDPDRVLSKRHCVLEERNGDYVIIDISTNGTFLNYGSERIGDIPTPLNNGDVIQLGSFDLVVEIAAAQAADQDAMPLPPAEDSLAMPDRPVGGRGDLADTGPSLDDSVHMSGDFLDDLLGGAPDADTPKRPSWDRPAYSPTGEDPALDPFSGDEPADYHQGASTPDHAPATQEYFPGPAVQAQAIPDDWDPMFISGDLRQAGGASADAPFAAPPAKDLPGQAPQNTAPPAAPRPPRAAPARPPAASRNPPAAHQAAGNDAALAFLEAAGAGHLDIPEAELAETMARMGRVFAAMVGGMREILMARAAIKSEMRMERTMINMGGNNPLKFSISPEQAVEAMIRPTVRGYLDAETATTEALNDIRAHEVAMMSGMEAALKNLLMRLGPDQLSARIESGSTFGTLLGGKKARYWEAYEKMYAQIAKETEDDFQSAFGREFARAYQDQLQKL